MNAFRSSSDRWLAGICGGLATQLGWSSGRVRLVWVLATVFTGFAGGLVYLALWFLMPKQSPMFESPLMQPWKRRA
jgi:phage shock protein PspC (stress-responsive transcriptional regulator)